MILNEMVDFTGALLRETDKALLVEIEGEELWFPKSQVSYWPINLEEKPVTIGIEVPRWLAIEKNLE